MLRNALGWAAGGCAACAVTLVACGDDLAFQAAPEPSVSSSTTAGTGAQGGAGVGGSGGGGGMLCTDADMDTVTDCAGDCDDGDANVHPGMMELCGDGLDNDCDGNGDPASVCQGLGSYVSALTGDDVTGDGTQQNPVQTIAIGMQNASMIGNGQPVFVAEGTYPEKVVVAEGTDLLGGHQCDTTQCGWSRDPALYQSLIADVDNQGVYAGDSVTRATEIDGFTIQAQSGNPGSNLGIAAITVEQGAPTIAHNRILGGQVINCSSNCWSSGVLVLGPSSNAQGVLLQDNLIVAGDSSDASFGIQLEPFGNKPAAEIVKNDVRGGAGRYTRAINAFNSGPGTLIQGNVVSAGTLSGNSPHSSFALVIGGNLKLDGNFINADTTLVGSCPNPVAGFWCGGIDSEGATATVTNNVVFGMPSPRSVALRIAEGEVPFGILVVNGNTLDGGGVPNPAAAISSALSCRTAQGSNAHVGNIRNNILRGGSAHNRFGFYEEDQATGKTCEPTVYENNDIWFPPQINSVDNAHRQWTGAGLQVLLADAAAVDLLPYAQSNMQQDPLLDSTFHLNAASPCIDSGTNAEAPMLDFDGQMRPQGNGIDIGADEAM